MSVILANQEIENEELAELFDSTLNELRDISTEHEDTIDFDVVAQELFGAGIQDIFDAENGIVTDNDKPIDWDAPANEIMESINLLEDGNESDFEEGESTIESPGGIKTVHEAHDSVTKLKTFFMEKGYGGDFMTSIMKLESLVEKKVIMSAKTAEQWKVTDFFQKL